VKILLILGLIAAGVCIYLHDQNQAAQLDKAAADNALLTQQLADKQPAINGLQLKLQRLTAQVAQGAPEAPSRLFPPTPPAAAPQQGQKTWGLQGADDLNRPAYNTH
jgi:hypothetical protein